MFELREIEITDSDNYGSIAKECIRLETASEQDRNPNRLNFFCLENSIYI